MNDAVRSARVSLQDAVGALQGARLVDLTHVIEPGMPVHPSHPQFFAMPWDSHDKAHSNQLLIGEHAGTHLDSPSHLFSRVGKCVSDIPLTVFFGPAVMLDFCSHRDDREFEVEVSHIEAWERSHHPLRAGDAVVLSFGWSAHWGLRKRQKDHYLRSWPAISLPAAEYLVSRGARLIGTDCLSVDGPRNDGLDVHEAFLGQGIPILENLDGLHRLPDSFLLMAFPLKIKGGTGSPVRAVALVASDDHREDVL